MILYNNFSPSVSVILPAYNRAALIKRSIDSVLKQSMKDWELIIVDDGSEDDTYKIVNRYINDFPNVRYIKQQHRKLPLSLNTGIIASSGKYITFLGSDDEYSPSHLSIRNVFMKNNPAVDLIYGGVEIIGDQYVTDKNDTSKKIHLSECVIGGTFFGKRSMFIELNGFMNLEYSEDSEFFERAEKKYNIKKVDYPTYIYHRDTEGSITNSM